ncbi:TALPID3 protein [Bienertia sinuspersici]
MVISWILACVSENIKKYIMFMTDAEQMWRHLESRNSITNGATKYNLNKKLYGTKKEINAFVQALNDQKEELRRFQFLNGLDEEYNS